MCNKINIVLVWSADSIGTVATVDIKIICVCRKNEYYTYPFDLWCPCGWLLYAYNGKTNIM